MFVREKRDPTQFLCLGVACAKVPPPFRKSRKGSSAKQVQQRWAHWQMQLPLEDIQRLLAILGQSNMPAQRTRRFKAYFKQVAVSCLLEFARVHLVNRIDKNGWALGPSAAFLEWLAKTPVSQVGAVPRYAVLRWARSTLHLVQE